MEHRFDRHTELLIDGVRGAAALLVMFTHAFDLSVADAYGWDYAGNPEGWRWARASVGHGGFWVWCFFVISGLCIHRSIACSVATGTFSGWRYAVARVTRIYPLFLVGLVLAFLAWLLHEDFGEGFNASPGWELAASLFSLQIFTTPFPAYETSWSLSCEMLYYAVWPVALITMRRRVGKAAAVSFGVVLAVALSIMTLWKGLHLMEHSALVEGVWIVTVLFPVWVCGAWLAGNWASASQAISRRTWFFSILLCLLSEGLLVMLKYHQYPMWAVHLAGWSAIPGLMLFLGGGRHSGLARRSWAEPVCRWLGQLSYPCYILHMQLLLLVDHFVDLWGGQDIHREPLWHSVSEFFIVLVLLAMVGPRLERGLMGWRSRILKRMATPT